MNQSLNNFASVYMPIIVTSTGNIQKTIQGNGQSVVLKADAYNRFAALRLDGVLRNMLSSGRNLKDDRTSVKFYSDKELNVVASVDGQSYNFMRNVEDLESRMLTNMPKIKNYPGYECGICFKANGDEVVELNGSRIAQGDLDISECVLTAIIKQDNAGAFVVLGDYVDDTIRIENAQVPEHPFYVRWLNRFGGWDYFMFACRQKMKHALVSSTSYEKYDAEGQKTTLKKEGQDIVEVSSGIVGMQTLREIMSIAYSPDIRLYKKDTQEWVPIQYLSGDDEYMTDQPTGEVVIQFEMPSPRMQC